MIEKLRGAVRPLVTLSGWFALVVIVLYLVRRFGTAEMTTVSLTALLTSISIFLGFWFKERSAK